MVGDLTNVKWKAIRNCHSGFPLYNEYILIKMKNKILIKKWSVSRTMSRARRKGERGTETERRKCSSGPGHPILQALPESHVPQNPGSQQGFPRKRGSKSRAPGAKSRSQSVF
jgi:hypothetical protein